MSRFKRLVENTLNNSTPDALDTGVTSHGRFGGNKSLTFTASGSFTEAGYNCIAIPCSGSECSETLVYIIEPEYDIYAGEHMTIPLEIVFTRYETKRVKNSESIWAHHVLATGEAYEVCCPSCKYKNHYTIGSDGGIFVATLDPKHVEVTVPKDRIEYLSNPKDGWNLEN